MKGAGSGADPVVGELEELRVALLVVGLGVLQDGLVLDGVRVGVRVRARVGVRVGVRVGIRARVRASPPHSWPPRL